MGTPEYFEGGKGVGIPLRCASMLSDEPEVYCREEGIAVVKIAESSFVLCLDHFLALREFFETHGKKDVRVLIGTET